MTVEEVRDQLPDVSVRLADGTIVSGHLSGRKNDFATVWLHIPIEFAWETIATAINTGNPLRIGGLSWTHYLGL